MSETKVRLAQRVADLEARVALLQDAAETAQQLLDDLHDERYPVNDFTRTMMADLQGALTKVRKK